MDIAVFLNSYPGMYLIQSFFHSLIAALVVDTALQAWNIEGPVVRQRFRLIVIIIPLISFPLYQLLNPARSGLTFRLDALLDANRWLNIEVWGVVPVGLFFFLFLGFATAVFLFQEMVPIVRHAFASRDDVAAEGTRPAPGSPVARALETLPGEKPDVFILDDDEFVLFSVTGRRPAVFLSSGLVQSLTVEQLRAAMAHEIGHIRRSRRPLLIVVFLLRILMFFNPVALMEFRRIVQEEENICDDVAVAMTGNRAALAQVLEKFHSGDDEEDPVPLRDAPVQAAPGLRDRLEEYSHTMLIESRISRLAADPARQEGRRLSVFFLTLATVFFINYFVV
jgi:Zn-dependent protease with chaperone function